jgi:uncharacterized cupredoxin-like copper-binding protein
MKFLNAIATAALLNGVWPVLAQDHKHDGEQKPWGIVGKRSAVTRTIPVSMTDNMRFTPARIEVRQGETVRFVVKNSGKVLHEFVLGTRQELDAHAAMMASHPGMQHEEAHMVHVRSAKSKPLVWNFNRPGEFQFACLIPGHYQAGMVGSIIVLPASTQGNKS